jgi:hypothetical protein
MDRRSDMNESTEHGLADAGSSPPEARQRTAEAARETGGEVATVAHEAAAQASTVAREAGQGVQDVVDEARRVIHDEADKQTHALSDSMRRLGGDLTGMSHNADDTPAADYVGRIGDSLESAAARLDDGGIDGALDQLRSVARRRPGMFLLGSAMSGFAVARVMRHADAPSRSDRASLTAPSGSQPGHPDQVALGEVTDYGRSQMRGPDDQTAAVDLRDDYDGRPDDAPRLRDEMQEWVRP